MTREAVTHPIKRAEWEIQHASSNARKGWVDTLATARNATIDAWDQLTVDPLAISERMYDLQGSLDILQTAAHDTRPQRQFKITDGGRIWFYAVPAAKGPKAAGTVHLTRVETGHTNETAAKNKRWPDNREPRASPEARRLRSGRGVLAANEDGHVETSGQTRSEERGAACFSSSAAPRFSMAIPICRIPPRVSRTDRGVRCFAWVAGPLHGPPRRGRDVPVNRLVERFVRASSHSWGTDIGPGHR